FPDGMRNDVQVIAMPLSVDHSNLPDTLAMLAASAALMVSDIPWNGPIGAVRVGRIDGQFLINPTLEQIDESDLDLVGAGTEQAGIMIEADAKFVSDTDLLAGIDPGHEVIKAQGDLQEELARLVARPKPEVGLH